MWFFEGSEPVLGSEVGPQLGIKFIPFFITAAKLSRVSGIRGVVFLHDAGKLLEYIHQVLVGVGVVLEILEQFLSHDRDH